MIKLTNTATGDVVSWLQYVVNTLDLNASWFLLQYKIKLKRGPESMVAIMVKTLQ